MNSQFDARDEGRRPELPFTVSDFAIPAGAAPASASATASSTATSSASGIASPVPDTGGISPNSLLPLVALLLGAGAVALGYAATRRPR